MSRIFLALRAFFAILFNAQLAPKVEGLLAGPTTAEPSASVRTPPVAPKAPPKPARSEALTLLATLQQEARFVDLVQEPLDQYNDAQIGAAARDVIRNCGKVLQRLFDLQPLEQSEEGAAIEVPAGYDPQRFRLTGNVSASPPLRGRIVHHGWRASTSQLPVWNGGPEAADVVAPVEVEV